MILFLNSSQNLFNGLNILLNIIVENYLVQSYCVCFISKNGVHNVIDYIYTPGLPKLMIEVNGTLFDKHLMNCIDLGCQTFVVTADAFTTFQDHYFSVHDRAMQRHAEKYVIILSERQETNQLRLKKQLIEEIPSLLLLNSNTSSNETIELLTIQDNTLQLKDVYNVSANQFLFNHDVFPSFSSILNGRSVQVATIHYLPNSYFKAVPAGEGNAFNASKPDDKKNVFIDGTESIMMLELCQKYNCTLNVSFVEGLWGEIYPNRTGGGILGALVEYKADVGYAALYPWYHEHEYLSLSAPVYKVFISCLVPRPKLLPYWLTPLLPFPLSCWAGLLSSYFVTTIAMKLVNSVQHAINENKFDNTFEKTAFDVAAVYFLQAIKLRHAMLSQVFIFTSLIIIGLVLDNIYTGGLAAVLTIPQYEKPIDTIAQLAQSNMGWAGNHDVWLYSILLATQPDVVKLISTYKTRSDEEMTARSTQGNLAYVMEREQFGHVATQDYIHIEGARQLQLMTEEVYWEYITMYSPKTWPYLNVLNEMILWVAQTGIQSYWELMTFAKYGDHEIQQTIIHARDDPEEVLIKLKISHLLGAFFILAFGLTIAAVVFILEKVGDRLKKEK